MKKLIMFSGLALVCTAVIAHLRGGVALMSARELGIRSARALIGLFHASGLPFEDTSAILVVLSWFLRPGAYLISRIGIDPALPIPLALASLIGWWGWLTAARLCFTIIGRQTGLIGVDNFHKWLWIGVPWRPLGRVYLRLLRWWRQFSYGGKATAAWTGLIGAMTNVFLPGDCVYLGLIWWCGIGLWQPVGIRGPRHVMVIAASGAGKTRWLMAWVGMIPKAGAAFLIDCDGQIVNGLGRALAAVGHKLCNLDPYGLSRIPGCSWNALDELTRAAARFGRQAVVRFAQTLAEALIQEDNKNQPVFATSARNFLLGLILFVWLNEEEENRNLVRVRELLTRGMPEHVLDPKQDPFDILLSFMEQTVDEDDGCEGKISAVIARSASIMRSGKTREGNPFRSTAISQTAWLDIPEIAAISLRSDFACEELKLSNPCVFVCAPVVDIQTKLAGWVRALTMMTMYSFQNIPGQLKIPCAFCIDEMPSLGRMEILETAAPVFRKYGARMVCIAQDVERLRQAYPQSWGSFTGNSQATIWMSTDHQETREDLSKILGTATVIEKISVSSSSKVPARIDRREEPLMRPDQLGQFLDPERGQFIVTRTGKPPMRIVYSGYDKALSIFRYQPDPGFKEPLMRATTRAIVNWLRPVPIIHPQ